jgi:hypothetical protein
MMVLSALRPDASLLEFLAHRARSASARRLAADVAVSSAAFVAVLRWNPRAQLVIACAATVLVCYAAWGLLDRLHPRIANRGWLRTAGLLEALSALCAVLGTLAAGGVLLAIWAIALGTWIS